MNRTIAYCKPNIAFLGCVAEIICGTRIKGPAGVVEGIQKYIQPAYDLDE